MTIEEIEQSIASYGEDVFRFCCYLTGNRSSAEDLYQDTFLKAMEITRPVKPDMAGKFLAGVAANLWKNQWRKEKRRQKYVMQDQKENTVHGTKVALKEVKLTTTEVGSYLSARYEEKGVSRDASASWLELCDEDGKPVSFGGMDGGRCYEAGKNEYVSEGCYENIGLPEKIYLSIGDSGEIVELMKQE